MVTTIVVLVLAAVFGAADQYLGSFSMHPWMADVSLLSAPWLALPFFAGFAARRPAHAALLGLACTFAALVGYGLMTLSPVEHAQLTTQSAAGFVRSSRNVFLGGLVTGPLFGWLGQQWRTRSAWWGGLAVAAALCLEPMLRIAAGRPIGSSPVLLAEIAAGAATAASLATSWRATMA